MSEPNLSKIRGPHYSHCHHFFTFSNSYKYYFLKFFPNIIIIIEFTKKKINVNESKIKKLINYNKNQPPPPTRYVTIKSGALYAPEHCPKTNLSQSRSRDSGRRWKTVVKGNSLRSRLNWNRPTLRPLYAPEHNLKVLLLQEEFLAKVRSPAKVREEGRKKHDNVWPLAQKLIYLSNSL